MPMPMSEPIPMQELSDTTYRQIAALMQDSIGLSLNDSKKALVSARLSPRMHHLALDSFEAYLHRITGEADAGEFQVAVDLLTTNETYFFREPQHFELLEQLLIRQRPSSLAVWSAASSFGDEAYSIAMLLSDLQQQGLLEVGWSVLGTDISDRVLRSARQAVYPQARLRCVSPQRLRRYCLRGEGEAEGLVQIQARLTERVQFGQLNLCRPIEPLGPFDVVFLRNVLIYFDHDTKRAVVDRVLARLRPGGLFFIGTAECRVPCDTPLEPLAPGVFRKPAASPR